VSASDAPKSDRRIVRTMAEATDFLQGAAQAGLLYLDTETTGLRPHDGDRLVGFSAHWRKGGVRKSIYVPFRHEWKPEAASGDLFEHDRENDPFDNAAPDAALEIVRAVPALPVPNIWWHARFDSAILSKDEVLVDWSRTRCAMLLCQIIYAGKYDDFRLKPFALGAFGLKAEDRAALDAWFKKHKMSIRTRGAMAKANPYLVAEYAMADCEMVADVRERSMKDYDSSLQATVHLEYAAMPELNFMEEGGCAVRYDFLREQEAKLTTEADSIAAELGCEMTKARELADYLVKHGVVLTELTGGGKTWEDQVGAVVKRLSSPDMPKGASAAFERGSTTARTFKDLSDLFDDICARHGISPPKDIVAALQKKGTSRQIATHEKALSKTGHPLALRVLRWKELTKSIEFLTALRQFAESGDGGRIHPGIRQLGADTGRTSQSEPNLQQMPRSADAGVRRAFVAPEGFNLWLIDYEQLQLRIAAIIAPDKKMIDAFLSGRDIHKETQIALGIKERSIAKNVNFAIVFGSGAETLANTINKDRTENLVTVEQAQAFLDALRQAYPDVRQAYFNFQRDVKLHGGWARLPSGRRRWLPPEFTHVALNTCIQMWEADITKGAIARLGPAVRALGGYIQNFVHDEFQIVLPESVDEGGVWRLARSVEVYDHIVPITVSVAKAEPTWGQKRELEKDRSYGMRLCDLQEQGLTMVVRRRSDGRYIYIVPSRDKAAGVPSGVLVLTIDEAAEMMAAWEIRRREDEAELQESASRIGERMAREKSAQEGVLAGAA